MAAATSTCSMCGRERDPSVRCPHCGNTPEQLAAEVARLNKAIADMNAEDLRLSGERKKLSGKLQAALYQRDILAHAEAQRQKKAAPKQRRWIPRPPGAKDPAVPPRTHRTRPRPAPRPGTTPQCPARPLLSPVAAARVGLPTRRAATAGPGSRRCPNRRPSRRRRRPRARCRTSCSRWARCCSASPRWCSAPSRSATSRPASGSPCWRWPRSRCSASRRAWSGAACPRPRRRWPRSAWRCCPSTATCWRS
ncbi:hypothetical protein ACFQZ4_20290 [Catellatospora coxensis]